MSEIQPEVMEKIFAAMKNNSSSEEDLSKYLLRVIKKLQKKAEAKVSIRTLEECAYLALEDQKPLFQLTLSPTFLALNQIFTLTSGLGIIAAPSGQGKTLWAMEWAKQAAINGHHVLFVSLEMTHEDLGARDIAGLTQIPLESIVLRKLTPAQKEVAKSLIGQSGYSGRIYIDKFESLDWVKIYPRLHDHLMNLKPKLVIIDFIQMLEDSDQTDGRYSKLYGDIARDMKLFADMNDVAVLLLSQLNREGLKEAQKKLKHDSEMIPLGSEYIKESGSIVEAADSVQLVCIPSRIKGSPHHLMGQFQITIEKNRKLGKLGTALIPYDETCGRFK